MDVKLAEDGPCRRTLNIVIPPEKVKEHISQVYKQAASQVEIKGFRPGKVPRRVLEKKYGDQILAEAKESLINQSFENALREQGVTPLGRPDLKGVDEKPLDEAAGLEFEVHFDVRPEIEISNVKGLEVPRGVDEVTDEDVESALGQLANEKRTLQSVDEPVGDGDFVKTDLVFKNEQGELVSERKGAQLNTNIPVAGTDAEAFATKLRGAEKGSELELELVFPDTFDKEEVRGQKGTVSMTVEEVLRVTPAPIDDELAKKYDFETLEAMREELTKRVGEEKARSNKARQEQDLINILINENQFDLPQSMVEDQAEAALKDFRERLKQAGMEEAEIESKIEGAKDEARTDAERRVRAFFVLEAVAKKEKIFVTEGDMEVELRQIAAHNNVSVEEVREHYETHRMLPDLRLGLMERKVRDFLRDNAVLTD